VWRVLSVKIFFILSLALIPPGRFHEHTRFFVWERAIEEEGCLGRRAKFYTEEKTKAVKSLESERAS